MVERQRYELDDFFFRLGGLTRHTESGFIIDRYITREMTYSRPFQTSITFELSDKLISLYRSTYSNFDFFSDLGGLLGFLRPLSLALVLSTQSLGEYQFILGETFINRPRKPSARSARQALRQKIAQGDPIERQDDIQWNFFEVQKLNY